MHSAYQRTGWLLGTFLLLSLGLLHAQITNGTYVVKNLAGGIVWDDPGGSTSNGTGIVLWTANGGKNQNWTFTSIGNGYYTIQNQASGLLLDDPNSSTSNGTQLIQWPSNGGNNQHWKATASGSGFILTNQASGLVVDDPGGSSTAGTKLIQWSANGGNNQVWLLSSSGGGTGGTTYSNVYVTLYGWPDNSPPGNAIAYPKCGGYPTVHCSAQVDQGTWAAPSSVASDLLPGGEEPVGRKIYVPYVQRYFVMEDECSGSGPPIAGTGNCEADWNAGKRHIDLWIGGNSSSNTTAVLNCENKWTRSSETYISNPSNQNLTVNPTPIFNSSTNQCR